MSTARPESRGRSRSTVVVAALAMLLALTVSLTGCVGASEPSATPTKTSTKTKTPKAEPTESATVHTASPELVVDCKEIQVVLNAMSEAYPQGPALQIGQSLSEDNIAALTQIRDGFAALELHTNEAKDATANANTVIQGLLDTPDALLTQEAVIKFNDAGEKLSSTCAGTSSGEAE